MDLVNYGHGHVFPRADGVKARCGGPALCSVCAKDLVAKLKANEDIMLFGTGCVKISEDGAEYIPLNEVFL